MTTSPFLERCALLLRRLQRRGPVPREAVRAEPTPRVLPESIDHQQLESWENEGGAGARRAKEGDPRAPEQPMSR